MKRKLFGLTLTVALVLGLSVAVLGAGDGGGWPKYPTSAPVCVDCDCCE